MTDRLIRITTAFAVMAVAVVAAIISYQHAYELVRSHGESGVTARLLPFTVDGLIWAASMVVLDASRRNRPVPRLAAWSLEPGRGHRRHGQRQFGAWCRPRSGRCTVVNVWPALALVGSFELLMMLIRIGGGTRPDQGNTERDDQAVPPLAQEKPSELTVAPTLEQAIRAQYQAGYSQRAIARKLNIDRRKVKRILDQAA